jgi:hypothetical protein
LTTLSSLSTFAATPTTASPPAAGGKRPSKGAKRRPTSDSDLVHFQFPPCNAS